MKNYRGVRKWLNAVLVLGVAGMLTFAGCTEVDDTLGYELVPGNQQMEMRLHSIRKGFEARMFMSDSVKSSNLSYGYFGTTKSDTFGIRKVGFMTQYLWASISDRKNWYGYRPIFDSLQLLLSVSSYAGDTLQPQRFGVYRILNNDYLKDNDGNGDGTTDTTFFTSFNPVEAGCVDENDPLFTFTFPDGTTTGPATTAVTLEPTAAGLDYVKELMMQEGKYKNDSTVYTNDSLWVNYFCGLAILPLDFNGTTGATFATTLAESGMMLYGRNRDSVDATLIRDTLQTLFYFYDEYATTYGNVSVNTVERTNTRYIDYDAIVEKPGGGTVEPQQPFEQTARLQAQAAFMVVPSLWDTFNFTCVEAMWSGRPVICSRGAGASELIEDGACLQMGIGAIPDAVLSSLHHHSRLGIHTEMFSDGVIDLIESDVINCNYKGTLRGRALATFLMGSKRLYDFVDDNPFIEMKESSIVNDTARIRKNPRMVSINSAIEVDLTGQVCADSIGSSMYSGVGGQMDFIRGASLSEGGKAIIALPSITKRGESRIVPFLKQGAGVVTTRAHVHYVITENGIADLYGKTLIQRVNALVKIAHPSHQEAIERSYFEMIGSL